MHYHPPLKDISFVLFELFNAAQTLNRYPEFEEIDQDLMSQVIEEAGRFASEILFPTNAVGDREGCRFENGHVKTPTGFKQAYRQFQEAGWPALACDPAYGGQGLPHTLNTVLYEMLTGTNHAWSMFPGLLHGAYSSLYHYANDELKDVYLPKIVSGEWLATMCLTEPQAGSDLGLIRTKATPADNGHYILEGNKIFISGGEHDLTENIVHLVLARLPDAPPGSKGISLFLVPKFLPENGVPKVRNAVHCTGIEHKMGIHGSATCSIQFDQATGWLVGEPNKGLAAMFKMMNAARLLVGINGVGVSETVYQNALAYAKERIQMRAATRPENRHSEPADPIVMHPAIQRMLMSQKAYAEGGRMLAYYSALLLDGAEHHPDEQIKAHFESELALLTPIIKAMLTDQGFEAAGQAIQIFGGHGYIQETGIEQYLRDIKIAQIYEGTNEIQAIDLIMRKILADNGQRLFNLLDQIQETINTTTQPAFVNSVAALTQVCQHLRALIPAISDASRQSPDLPYQIAPEMLRLVGHAAMGWLWLKAATIADEQKEKDPAFYGSKIDTAQYYFDFILPETRQLIQVIDQYLIHSQQGHSTNYLDSLM
ncbi:acyl-CoA dehydrogenase family protein [Neopusillimonas maritima]|uniref:3-methylmercaptopropionyl-CoA dehydrogenase n=1 Tax=Neopusillimonas maritima TaxID=2026239 RepID=A0A3A1YZ53_9BURK|nr:acyl-CoA dehydrogenase family protein [Neopusillimonas maritima]RIY42579.1 acyl-CoA dehydrogenase [Neopusillimonas maritima]